ncbi:hypothetical protein MRB53_040053 [Persea americana]|nr:hypothetical protein MRB53_040053 [Persea americana]
MTMASSPPLVADDDPTLMLDPPTSQVIGHHVEEYFGDPQRVHETSEGDLSYRTSQMDISSSSLLSETGHSFDDMGFEDRSRGRGQGLRADCQTGGRRVPSGEVTEGMEQAVSILNSMSYNLEGWCKLAKLVSDDPKLSFGGANKFAPVGEVVAWAQGLHKPVTSQFVDSANLKNWVSDHTKVWEELAQILPEGSTVADMLPGAEPATEVSHLCHHPNCMTVGHVTLEARKTNLGRKGCLVYVRCSESCADCGGDKVISLCPHEPDVFVFTGHTLTMKHLLGMAFVEDDREESRRFFAEDAQHRRR